jgi:homogentisate 1,2-dioxygenase
MENCIGLERVVELFEFSRDRGIVDGQHSGFELYAETGQPRSMSAKRMDQRRRWVFSPTQKASEPRDENA